VELANGCRASVLRRRTAIRLARHGLAPKCQISKGKIRKSEFRRHVTVGRHIAVDLQTDADFNQNGRRPSHGVLPLSDVVPTNIGPTKSEPQVTFPAGVHACRAKRGGPLISPFLCMGYGPDREPALNTSRRAERMALGKGDPTMTRVIPFGAAR
jgi:hypothetical protein